MKTLYIDCGMGAAGDMLTAALYELIDDKDSFLHDMDHLGLPGVHFSVESKEKCGIQGTAVSVHVHGVEEESHDVHDHGHHHTHHDNGHQHENHHHGDHHHGHDHGHHHDHVHNDLHSIGHIVEALPVSDRVKGDIMAVYTYIGEAESRAHGVPVDQIHFHEVGHLDAITDITAVCLLMERLAPDQVIASRVHVGSGHVHCAHGVLPVPAPATAYILEGVPMYGGAVEGELCTPTGAALLRHFVDHFGDMPVLRTEKIGYGVGKKDFPRANVVRVLLGDTNGQEDAVIELSCNLDDMTPEACGFAMEQLIEIALDVWYTPVYMKKGRPGVVLSVLCKEDAQEACIQAIFQYTTTLGVRKTTHRRMTLERRIEDVETPHGPVRQKIATGYGVSREKVEYDDVARIARQEKQDIDTVRKQCK